MSQTLLKVTQKAQRRHEEARQRKAEAKIAKTKKTKLAKLYQLLYFVEIGLAVLFFIGLGLFVWKGLTYLYKALVLLAAFIGCDYARNKIGDIYHKRNK